MKRKKCTQCQLNKVQSQFYSGQSKCRDCISHNGKVERGTLNRKNKENKARTCIKCDKFKPATAFYGAYYPRCKNCHSHFVMLNEKANRKKYAAYRSKYQQKHPDKHKQWIKKWQERWEKENNMKYSTFVSIKTKARMEMDEAFAKKVKATQKKRYRDNIVEIAKKRKEYYLKNKKRILAKAKARAKKYLSA